MQTGFTFEKPSNRVRKYLYRKILSREKSTLHPQFEREITLPDRTPRNGASFGRVVTPFWQNAKDNGVCVDMDHARSVARLLQDEFGPETGFLTTLSPLFQRKEKTDDEP